MKGDFIEEAYRKLKGTIYADKSLSYLKAQIAEFEMNGFDEKMQEIREGFRTEKKWDNLVSGILKSIRVLTFPKEIDDLNDADIKYENNPVALSNIGGGATKIKKYNNFLYMDIKGHILGILWILMVGHKMDDKLISECYGNRVCDNLKINERTVSPAPNLFKPYYQQYESWRDKALVEAEKYLSNTSKDIAISMLDIKKYYYNVDLSSSKYKELTERFLSNRSIVNSPRLNEFVFRVLEKYSSCFPWKRNIFLPIGFLPSNILSNYYLNEFDRRVSGLQDIVYYGRYVDDIICVTLINDESSIVDSIKRNGTDCISEFLIKKMVKEKILVQSEGENRDLALCGNEELDVQKGKLRFFYLSPEGSDSLLKNVRKDIANNSSEFNFLPENIDEQEGFRILQLEREDTVNKMRSVNKASVDKYELSKMIGRRILLSDFVDEESTDTFIEELGKLLDNKELICNYTLWESLLNYYVINNRLNEIISLTKNILQALATMDEEILNKEKYNDFNGGINNIKTIRESLVFFYQSCLLRATAIVLGEEIENIIKEAFEKIESFIKSRKLEVVHTMKAHYKIRKGFCISRMINRSLLPVSMEACMAAVKPTKKGATYNMHSLHEYLTSNEDIEYDRKMRKYTPYIESPFGILFTKLMNGMKNDADVLNSDLEAILFMCDEYDKNYWTNKGILKNYFECEVIDETNNTQVSFVAKNSMASKESIKRVAVANVRMNEEDIKKNITTSGVDKTERCNEIIKIVNEAIRYDADVLIMPEAYVPLEFLQILQKKVSKHNMMIICGIEHFTRENKVYNLTATIIPLITDTYKYAIPFFHKKVHFAPAEVEVIKQERLIPAEGDNYSLYTWANTCFTTYCCYELTSIADRSIFHKMVDIIFGVEWNRDISYFSNIMEALSRDLYCICIQSNMSEYGDSRIILPAKSIYMNPLNVKGGINATVLVGEIDIGELHVARKGKTENKYKPLPANY